jgi:hypothetical protein
MPTVGLGWSPDASKRARARMLADRKYCVVGAPRKTPRPAVSVSHLRYRILNQAAAGTCYLHSPIAHYEWSARALGYEPFPACRRGVGWATMKVEGGGNMADGGSPTDALMVMTSSGVGIGHENLCPYPELDDEAAMSRALAVPPPQSVFDDARATHLVSRVDVQSIDQIIALIDGSSLGTCNGFDCPRELRDSATFLSSVGGFLGGHSVLIIGYALAGVFDQHRWLQLENWWKPIYKPLPNSQAKLVEGYEPATPNADTAKWVREDMYLLCCRQQGGCEHVSATGVDGLHKGVVVAMGDFSDSFSVI